MGVTQKAIWQALRAIGVTYKKALRHLKADVARRTAFRKTILAHEVAGKPAVYLDESGFAHDMPRTHGYSPCGKRCSGVSDWVAKGRTNVEGDLFVSSVQHPESTLLYHAMNGNITPPN